ncbi:menaquinone biosynthesis family protein [Nitratifractor sp.]
MNIDLAHSPDADDIFMYYAIAFGWVDTRDYRFRNEALDIETLNEKALEGYYDVSAISFALYPRIREDYALLRTAVSFGEGYGPKLVKLRGKRLRRNFRVALSGRHTTNAMLVRLYYPQARPVYMNFLEIERAVAEGEVDAGVLIHESILDFDPRLEVEKELWDVWRELSREDLPLPLGGMALRRSIPLNRAIEIEAILTEGVRVANARKKELSTLLEEKGLVRIGDEALDRYLRMYASEESAELDTRQIAALDRLFELGYRHGEYDCPIRTEEYLIPREYNRWRNL